MVFVIKEADMPLSKRRLGIYQKYYKLKLRPLREFDNGTNHPVVMMSESHSGKPRKANAWRTLMCPCDLKWRWEMFGNPQKRTMVMMGDGHNCPAKADARKVVREEVRAENKAIWDTLSLADAAYNIWQIHQGGEYLGEFNVGVLYVQDLEQLLRTIPDVLSIHLGEGRNAEGEVISPPHVEHISFPSKKILAAVSELKKRKLVDLNGMILVTHKEFFRFPEELHRQFAYWIEEPLGWPNGDAGDCFLFDLYRKIAKRTGWSSGEEVFGCENMPKINPAFTELAKRWILALSAQLAEKAVVDKGAVVLEISLEKWIEWLTAIRAEKKGHV
jgi:hypothetical protein